MVMMIRDSLSTANSLQKLYANNRKRALEFKVGHQVYLKISPIKGVMRFGKKGKLSPRYIGPYEVLQQVGNVDYKSQLSKDLASVHPLFYLSMFKKFLGDLTSILLVEGLGVDEILSYAKVPIEILDPQVKRLRNKDIIVKVLWRNHLVEGATCVAEADMRSRYPHLFSS
ncbi:uncharacterized protein [Solanum lycopersicum]|uniref:uncharacterized protein n=1 Tax=Solanum lycopersicum TaxID=4081 RepID=UPI0037478E0B